MFYLSRRWEFLMIFSFQTGNVKYIGLVASCESVSETCGPLTIGSKATESFSFWLNEWKMVKKEAKSQIM